MEETWVQSLGWGDLLEKQTATHSSIFAWEIPWTEEPGGLQSSPVQFSPVTQLCPTLCDPMSHSTLGLPVHHQLQEFTHIHVHRVGDAIQPSHPVIPFSSCLQSLPASKSFPMSQLFASDGQSIEVSASATVPPMNTQDWSPSGLQSMGSQKSRTQLGN